MKCSRSRTISADKRLGCLFALVSLLIAHPLAMAATEQDSTMQVSVEEVSQLVTQYILQHLPDTQQRVQVSHLRVQGNRQVPGGHVTYEIIPRTRRLAAGPVSLTIVVYVDGKPARRLLASGTIVMTTPVVVAALPLAPHQTITLDDVRLEERDLRLLPAGVLTDLQAVVGKRVRRSVNSGTPLHIGLVEAPTVIKRGDVVTIVAQSPSLSVATQGQAREDGAVGQQIRVVNLASRKEVYAKVIDEHTVRVDF
jgi:flagella basal body P-ring formation protein FlgA